MKVWDDCAENICSNISTRSSTPSNLENNSKIFERFKCPFPDCPFPSSHVNPEDYLKHLAEKHNFCCTNQKPIVAYIEHYVQEWIQRYPNESPFKDDPRDVEIRKDLQKRLLHSVMEQQALERNENQGRKCLFCKLLFNERNILFRHMFQEHSFNIGLPDNLVFVTEFLDLLEWRLNRLECIFCEKTFKDGPTLRLHMRKKRHFKISPSNHIYDRYYVINYLENASEDHSERDLEDEEADDESIAWDDWIEEDENESVTSLFDGCVFSNMEDAISYLRRQYNFDFDHFISSIPDYGNPKKPNDENKDDDDETFLYNKIKLVNYLRNATNETKCLSCNVEFQGDSAAFEEHLRSSCHAGDYSWLLRENLGSFNSLLWSQPKFLLPHIESDPFLYSDRTA